MESTFTAAPHHDILMLVIQLAVLLLTARLLGEVALRLGQSSVVGEILAGIVLGPSFLSAIFPVVEKWMIPHTPVQGYLLELVGLLGVLFLLLITGLETDLTLIRRQARSAVGVALGGLIVPLIFGFILGMLLPRSVLADPDRRFVFALYMATAMSISAIPVIAKVLMDFNLTRRDVGQTIIASAMIDDTTGWILLSIVIGLMSGAAVTAGSILASVGSVLGFMLLSFTAGAWLVRRILTFVQNKITMREKTLSMVMILTFAWGAIAQALHLEALLGAFVMGILLSRMPALDSEAVHKIESMTLGIFAPIFFAIAGLKVDILSLLEPQLMLITLLVIGVAVVCKILGIYAGARLIGKSDHWTALFLGSGLNARGSMGIIIANIGLSLGIITQDMFSIIVVMAVVTSLMAPAMLRWTLNNIIPEQEELERLRREEMNKTNMMVNIHRVLLPLRAREAPGETPTQLLEAHLLNAIGAKNELALTLLTVAPDYTVGMGFLNRIGDLFMPRNPLKKVIMSEKPGDAILDELKRGYDLLVVGASERQAETGSLFSPVIDKLVRLAPCPTLVVHSGQPLQEDWRPRCILVPTTGSPEGQRAAQVAFSLVADGGEVLLLKVIRQSPGSSDLYSPAVHEQELVIARQIVERQQEMGRLLGVETSGKVEIGAETEGVILEVARDCQADLIILGTSIRPGSERLYLGPKVERILNAASCPVIIVNSQ